jgi:signal transduction histidine kinase/CheY-like chemotaxis protein
MVAEMRSPRAFIIASFAGLAIVVALASWQDRSRTLRAAEDHVQLTVGLLREHALNVFATQELVHAQVQLRTAELDWEAISGSQELASFLRKLRDRMSEISSIWLADSMGHVRASSGLPYPPALTLENREEFRAHQEHDRGLVVGDQRLGTFGLSWRRSSSTGQFDGVIGIEIAVQYFQNWFRGLDAAGGSRAVLVRADGTVLAADPSTAEPARFPPGSRLMQSIASGVQNEEWGASPSGITHFFQWRQLDPYPVYVAYAVDKDVALRPWYRRVVVYALLATGVWAALCIINHFAARRAAAEAALRQAHRMEAIGQLASGVAHDFNNLLTTVVGNLDRIALHRQATPDVRRFAETALRAAQRGTSLTAQLLGFARQRPPRPTAVRIDRLFDAMLPLLRDAVGETIDVSCETDPDASAIQIDPGQFEAALLNLALNARDAMPRGGTLRITARNTIVAAGEAHRREIAAGDYVVMEITDSGSGMPADIAQRAFQPFFTTKGEGKGSGRGLAMVYGFARQSGGTAEIESRVGSGTTIKLYLPCSDETALCELPPPPVHPATPRKPSILVVEDQDEIRCLLAESLEQCGHEVKTSCTAQEAIALLEQDAARIDVLVTDFTLPGGMTGLDLARKARALIPDLKVLTISGNATEEVIRASCLERGAFLAKPFRPSDLTRAVAELL